MLRASLIELFPLNAETDFTVQLVKHLFGKRIEELAIWSASQPDPSQALCGLTS